MKYLHPITVPVFAAITAILLTGCASDQHPETVSAAPLRNGDTGILYTRPMEGGGGQASYDPSVPAMAPAESALPSNNNPNARAIYLPAAAGTYLTQGGSRDLQALPGLPFDPLAPHANQSQSNVAPGSAEFMPNRAQEAPLQIPTANQARPLAIYRGNIQYTGWARELGIRDPNGYDEAKKLIRSDDNETPVYIKEVGWVAWSPDREKSLVLPPALESQSDQ